MSAISIASPRYNQLVTPACFGNPFGHSARRLSILLSMVCPISLTNARSVKSYSVSTTAPFSSHMQKPVISAKRSHELCHQDLLRERYGLIIGVDMVFADDIARAS